MSILNKCGSWLGEMRVCSDSLFIVYEYLFDSESSGVVIESLCEWVEWE